MTRRVAVTGARGQLGRQLVRAFTNAGRETLPLARPDFDITDREAARSLIAWRPDVVVNSAAWTDVDACARDPDLAMRVNGEAAGLIAEAAESTGALIVQLSTNEVFAGDGSRPYTEGDAPSPINPYGRSKLAGEHAVATASPDHHLIVRTAWLFGPGGTNFVTKILAAARRAEAAGEAVRLVEDEIGNPTWTPDLAEAIVALVEKPPDRHIVHVVGTPPVSRMGWALAAFAAAELRVRYQPVGLGAFERASSPPARAILEPTSGVPSIDWRRRTGEYVRSLVAEDES